MPPTVTFIPLVTLPPDFTMPPLPTLPPETAGQVLLTFDFDLKGQVAVQGTDTFAPGTSYPHCADIPVNVFDLYGGPHLPEGKVGGHPVGVVVLVDQTGHIEDASYVNIDAGVTEVDENLIFGPINGGGEGMEVLADRSRGAFVFNSWPSATDLYESGVILWTCVD